MEDLINLVPWIWLGVAVLCVLIEAFTFSLTTIWFALGAVVLIFVSLTHIALQWQLLIFVVVSLLLLIFTRPFAVKKLKVKKTPTNADSLIGRKCIVTKEITELEKGEVKINGNEWSAQSVGGVSIQPGEEVTVKEIQGATLIVEKI